MVSVESMTPPQNPGITCGVLSPSRICVSPDLILLRSSPFPLLHPFQSSLWIDRLNILIGRRDTAVTELLFDVEQ